MSITLDFSMVIPSLDFTFDNPRFAFDGSYTLPAGGLRVQAVTSGYYNGVFRTQGDVFDLLNSLDYSDSTVNYQSGGAESGFGWMLSVPASTPLFDWLSSQTAPYLPPQDPARRTVY